MDTVTDSELYMLYLEENEEAKNELFKRYKYVVMYILKKYLKAAYSFGVEYRDLYSEALLGFSDGLASYNENKNTSLVTFISLCIERRLQKVIIKAASLKNQLNLQSLSLDYLYEDVSLTLNDIIMDTENEPLSKMVNSENYDELISNIKNDLSDFEYTVFTFMVNDFNYNEIASILGKSPKQIDNTISRIKGKLKIILESR